jgi:hypothetical protein
MVPPAEPIPPTLWCEDNRHADDDAAVASEDAPSRARPQPGDGAGL